MVQLMNLFEQYAKERENICTIGTESGFVMYKIEGDKCLIDALYVVPELRQSQKGSFFANQVFEICKERGVKTVYCQVDMRANHFETSIKAIEGFGFKEWAEL
jgi:N-acetylglutamate synthase-like GNAT family acetyltransferase